MASTSFPLVLTREQSRLLDQKATAEYHLASIVLMENAGRGVADVVCQLKLGPRVAICCGKGNNAGDGFVIARHLDLRGFDVAVYLWADEAQLPPDAAANLRAVRAAGIRCFNYAQAANWEELATGLRNADVIIDSLLGTGAQGAVRPPLDRAIDVLNQSGVPMVAVDLPSGLDCDTGAAAQHTIRAAHTCTFVAPKPGLLIAAAAPYVGQLHVLDIGAPRKLLEEFRTRTAEHS
jgi:NAD(P)H-hydrate epimerase